MSEIIWLGFYLVPAIVLVCVLAGVALLARRLKTPIMFTTAVVGAILGLAWGCFWAIPYGDAN